MNILLFFLPFILGLVLMPLATLFSKKTGFFVDSAERDELKIHNGKISILGGLAMIVPVFISFIFLERNSYLPLLGISVGILLFFLVCFWDDYKWKSTSKSQPILKSLMLVMSAVISAIVLYYSGISFALITIAVISIILSFIYIFIVTNSINFQDGADGLAGGVVGISLIGFFVLGIIRGNNLSADVSLIVLGAVMSFLIFNFPPAKIFMGDSGAYSLGFIIAVLAISFSTPYNLYSLLGPIFIIGIPVFEGVFSNLRRILSKESIFHGDRDHFYDKLLRKYSIQKTLLISYSLQIFLVVLGLLIYTYV